MCNSCKFLHAVHMPGVLFRRQECTCEAYILSWPVCNLTISLVCLTEPSTPQLFSAPTPLPNTPYNNTCNHNCINLGHLAVNLRQAITYNMLLPFTPSETAYLLPFTPSETAYLLPFTPSDTAHHHLHVTTDTLPYLPLPFQHFMIRIKYSAPNHTTDTNYVPLRYSNTKPFDESIILYPPCHWALLPFHDQPFCTHINWHLTTLPFKHCTIEPSFLHPLHHITCIPTTLILLWS